MKVIFLDIDGVLNSEQTIVQEMKNTGKFSRFSKSLVDEFNRIIFETDAKIVLSSSWRIGMSISNIKDFLIKNNVEGEVIGKT